MTETEALNFRVACMHKLPNVGGTHASWMLALQEISMRDRMARVGGGTVLNILIPTKRVIVSCGKSCLD